MNHPSTMCKKCGNEFGFSFGTCCQCGWNDISNSYHFIRVNPDHIRDDDLKNYLVDRHDSFVTHGKQK